MNVRIFVFVTLLLLPILFVFVLNSVEKTNTIDTLASINDLLGITLLPFIGGLIFKNKKSYLLAVSIPLLFILSKSLFFDGAERIVTVGLIMFLSISLISCSLAVAGKYIYQKHLTRNSNGTAQKRAAP